MATLPMDTLRVSRRLRDVGFSEPQTEAVALVVAEVRNDAAGSAVTHQDLKVALGELRNELREEFRPVKADVLLLRWMAGFGLTMGVAILLKLFAFV